MKAQNQLVKRGKIIHEQVAPGLIALIILSLNASTIVQASSGDTIRYHAENGAIVGHNINRYNNRPLYVDNTDAFVLAGDKPLIRFAHGNFLLGTFMAAIVRDSRGKWLQDFSHITSIYRSGRMTWELSDTSFPGLAIRLDALPMDSTIGMALRMKVEGAQEGDRLVWVYGGIQPYKRDQLGLNWHYDALVHPKILTWGFTPNDCSNNSVRIDNSKFLITLPDSTSNPETGIIGYSTGSSNLGVGDASVWKELPTLTKSMPERMPIVKGIMELKNGKEVYWAVKSLTGSGPQVLNSETNPEKAFSDGEDRDNEFQKRLKINTPDHNLNALAQDIVAAVDGRWYPPVFVHGPMQWNSPYLGWRTTFGPIMLGWHKRVQTEARYFFKYQVKKSNKTKAEADSSLLLTIQAPSSIFYGVGHIDKDQAIYNMQTQFFNQMIKEWRFTGDPNFEKILRPALDLDLAWERRCFDPDNTGVYDSYINTWPTDSQWYNGGGTAEETSYAYDAQRAARDMARLDGDSSAAEYHSRMMKKIRRGFFAKLWIKSKGYSGAYREQGGHERLHEDPWLYSIFLPIDVGLTSRLQAIESLYYTQWALQNDTLPSGGRMVWSSNWVPPKWSVRELYPGDNYALALAYFQAGLPDNAWDIMRGTFMKTAFGESVPGNFGTPVGGTDFGDCADMFARVLVQGLFGYNPDYPDKVVNIDPEFPPAWNHASIELPDVRIKFDKNGPSIRYHVQLARAARLDLRIPVETREVNEVLIDGKPTRRWKLLPSAGCSVVQIWAHETAKVNIEIQTGEPLPYYRAVDLQGNVSESITLAARDARIVDCYDPQGVLEGVRKANGIVTARLTKNKGFHTVVAKVMAGDTPQWRIFHIKVNDPAGDARYESKFVHRIPANATWATIDIGKSLNADVRTIYEQKYLSPRPNTVAARIGSDGYSPWTFPLWRLKPPKIQLNQVQSENGILTTPEKVPFKWLGNTRNIAFTSMWNNFPSKITIPVDRKGDAIWFLVAGSTNPMQCDIANAGIR